MVIVYATESLIQLLPKTKIMVFRQSKQQYRKAQVLHHHPYGQVMRRALCRGRHNDFALFKKNRLPIPSLVIISSDLGYFGITAIHSSTIIPHKSSKLIQLTNEQKEENKQGRHVRIKIEYFLALSNAFEYLRHHIETKEKDVC